MLSRGQGAACKAAERLATAEHGGDPEAIRAVCIDMSPAYVNGVEKYLPNATVTFDKFHVIAHASHALDLTRRAGQNCDPGFQGVRWTLLKDHSRLSEARRADLDALLANLTTKRTARAWQYREDLHEIINRKQVNVVRDMLRQWCTNVMRSKVESMKNAARMIRAHLDGIVAWARSHMTNGFLEALIGLFQAAKRKAHGYRRLSTIQSIIFLIAGKSDFRTLNPHAAKHTRNSTDPPKPSNL